MSPENKEYVVVNEKDFWNKETLKLNQGLLASNSSGTLLTDAINTRMKSLNTKLDANYSTIFLEKWKIPIDNKTQAELASQLKDITQWFNNKLDEIVKKYKWAIDENMIEITEIIDKFFVEEIEKTLNEQAEKDKKDNISWILKQKPVMWKNNPANIPALTEAGML